MFPSQNIDEFRKDIKDNKLDDDNKKELKIECKCCTIAKVQGLLGLFHECCKDKECEC